MSKKKFPPCVYCGQKPSPVLANRTTGYGDRLWQHGEAPRVPENFTDSDIKGLAVCNGCFARKYPEKGPSISAACIEQETKAIRARTK